MDLHVSKNLSDQVYDIILSRIFSGEYHPGDKLSVNKLAKEFNISRSPVNDALNKLSGACLVEMKQYSSCNIRKLSKKQVLDLLEFRKAIELYVVDTAFDEICQKAYGRLKEIANALDNKINGKSMQDLISFFDLDDEFHQVFISVLGNDYINSSYENANKLLRLVSLQVVEAKDASPEVAREHNLILEAIGKKDKDNLKNALNSHFVKVSERYIRGIS